MFSTSSFSTQSLSAKSLTWFGLLLTLGLLFACNAPSAPTTDVSNNGGAGDPNVEVDPNADTGDFQGTIGISVQTLTNPFFKVIADTVEAEAAKHGYQTLKRDAETKVANQNEQVKEFIVKGVDAIILCPRDSKAIGPVIIEANKAGIPVFTIDTVCEDPTARVVFHVGTDNRQGGQLAGKAMITALGQAGGKVAVLEFKQVDSCNHRVEGFTQEIDLHNKTADNKIEIVGHYECGGDREKGQSATRDAFNATPDLVGIFAINDPAALGARGALEAEGKADQVVVVGFDGQPEGKKAVESGALYDTPTQFPDQMAKESIAAVMKYFDGVEVEPSMLILTESYRKQIGK